MLMKGLLSASRGSLLLERKSEMPVLNNVISPTPYKSPVLPEEAGIVPFKKVLGMHLNGHDASVAVVNDGELVEVIEFERVFREKHCRLNVLHPRFKKYVKWLFEDYKIGYDFDAVALHLHNFGSEPREYHEKVRKHAVEVVAEYLPHAHYLQLSHHLCHASSSYFTSPFEDAIILSMDGHGDDGSTIGFHGTGEKLSYIKGFPFSLGRAYSALSNIIGGIHSADGNSAGKVMGLTAYGNVKSEWKQPIHDFITSYTGLRSEFSPLYWEPGVADGVFYLPGFGVITGKEMFNGPEDPNAQDFAATFQEVWSQIVQNIISDLVHLTGTKNVCLVGGCALNATTNYDVMNMTEVEDIHLIPHPSDAGISSGAALYAAYAYCRRPWKGASNRFFSPYLGVPILDLDKLEILTVERTAERPQHPTARLAELIASGSKIGVMQGRSEVGPRALGNRSLLCDPRNPAMKDIINQQIKGREWYRPFAPVVREGEQDRFFVMSQPAPYMSFIANVRSEWVHSVPSIVHADGTARVQTISKEQNSFLWQLIGDFEEITGLPMLLNTSFNGRGEPIYTRIEEALRLLDATDLDGVYVEGSLFT